MPAKMPASTLNDDPPRETWAWGVTYRDEPVKGKPSVTVSVRVPRSVGHIEDIGEIAVLLRERFGWIVYKGPGWGYHDFCVDPDGLAILTVSVRAREIREALAAREQPGTATLALYGRSRTSPDRAGQ